MSKTIDLGVLMLALITEGQDNSERYGFEVGDIIKFSPSEIQIIADKYAKEQPAIEQPHWISCSKRLPEEDEDVLLQFSSNMGVGFYRDGWAVNTGEGIYSVVDYSEEKPIAWMPLPEPYGGESE